jgi:DNA-binding transcriptional regulator PaaX
MKGEKTLRILEMLEISARNIGQLIDAMTSGYEESYRKLRTMQTVYNTPLTNQLRTRWQERQKARVFIEYLKRDGLVKSENKDAILTAKGFVRLRNLRDRARQTPTRPDYQPSPGTGVVLVIFDVPEKQKRKRVWLRAALKQLGFQMVQKSVWFGKVKIPKNFLEDLGRHKIIDCVEIFAITKTGSLKRV